MVERTSVLRRLPVNLEPSQRIYLDGFRHAAELSSYAFEHLVSELAVLSRDAVCQQTGDFIVPFHFAWSFIDASDRLVGLLRAMPGIEFEPVEPGKSTFFDRMKCVRDLRNLSDHIATRVQFIVAKNGTALGVLSWTYQRGDEPEKLKSCSILPGTMRLKSSAIRFPVAATEGEEIGTIYLEAATYSAELRAIHNDVAKMVGRIETALSSQFEGSEQPHESFGSDILIALDVDRSGMR